MSFTFYRVLRGTGVPPVVPPIAESLNVFPGNSMIKIKSVISALCLALAVSACSSEQHAHKPYAEQSDIDTTFAQGAGRAPTARTLHQMAIVLAAQGKDAEAFHVLTRCIETYPNFCPAYDELAALHLRHDRVDEAKAALMSGLALKGDDPVLHNNLGMIYLTEKDYKKALESFEAAAKAQPANARYQANRALAMGMAGDYDRSLDTYLTIMPPGEAHYNIAVISEARNDSDRAAKEYAQAKLMGFKEKDKENKDK